MKELCQPEEISSEEKRRDRIAKLAAAEEENDKERSLSEGEEKQRGTEEEDHEQRGQGHVDCWIQGQIAVWRDTTVKSAIDECR